MLTRILTALIGVVVFFAVLALPSALFPLAIFAVTVIMLGEMYSVIKCGKYINCIGYLSSAAAFVAFSKKGEYLPVFLVAMTFFYLFAVILRHGKTNCRDILAHGFITLYIAVSMTFIARINTEFSALATLWVFIIAWITDSGAYFAGVFLGKHKLCPHISPKKTVEGALGGLLATVIACAVYYVILVKTGMSGDKLNIVTLLSFVAMGFAGSLLSQAGDLVASCIKRDYDVKDYGSILPGHGGLMDRFDSVVFIAPLVYYAIWGINQMTAV